MAAAGTKVGRGGARAEREAGPLPLPEPLLRAHAPVVERALAQWAETKRVPPVLLITGPAGAGKRELCHHISQWLLCDRGPFGAGETAQTGAPAEDDSTLNLFGAPAAPPAKEGEARLGPCGECPSCRRALDGNWIDFQEIAPEGAEDGKPGALKIEQFRDLKASQGFGAHQGAYRITLIRDADRMTVQAANSLLKLLEEPPKGWVFLLTAADASLLLPTLISRCQRLRLHPLGDSAVVELLAAKGVAPGRREICARLARGSWTKAQLLASDETWERRGHLFRYFREPQSELNALVDWAASEPARFTLLLDQLEQALSDLIAWSLEAGEGKAESYRWANSDQELSLKKHSESLAQTLGGAAGAREFWLSCFETLSEVRRKSSAPLNRKLLAQELLFPWMEL
ncbi:MAG: hypothetical protein IT285_10490 [Bdellovibrionales bacterium]|nr:hypothetical protein [Bdellovibrionales bacterium]